DRSWPPYAVHERIHHGPRSAQDARGSVFFARRRCAMIVQAQRRPRVLVVEDETSVALDIKRGFKRFGYESPSVVDNGRDAIREAERTHPDLVLMDIQLRGDLDAVDAA